MTVLPIVTITVEDTDNTYEVELNKFLKQLKLTEADLLKIVQELLK